MSLKGVHHAGTWRFDSSATVSSVGQRWSSSSVTAKVYVLILATQTQRTEHALGPI